MNGYEFAAIVILAGCCIFWIIRHDLQQRRQAAWDAHVDTIVTDTETPIFDELAIARLTADLDKWGRP